MYQIISIISIISFLKSQSIQDIRTFQQEYQKMLSNNNNIDFEKIINDKKPEIQRIDQDFFEQIIKKDQSFCYDFLSNKARLSFGKTYFTPDNYQLGSGDELIISIWGETQLRQNYIILEMAKFTMKK